MTKTYCDRCGKEIDKLFQIFHLDYGRLRDGQYGAYVFDAELCEDCRKDYRKFIEGAKVTEE